MAKRTKTISSLMTHITPMYTSNSLRKSLKLKVYKLVKSIKLKIFYILSAYNNDLAGTDMLSVYVIFSLYSFFCH